MKISPLELELVEPGRPIVVERYFVQRQNFHRSAPYWSDVLVDANINGETSPEAAKGVMDRVRVNYANGVGWRIIKRICTITAEVVR